MFRLVILNLVCVFLMAPYGSAQNTEASNQEENEIFFLKSQILQQNDWIQIYPNPSFGELTLVSELQSEVFIVSETGNYIKNITLLENEAQLIELPKGNYIVNIKSGDRIIPKRVLVN
jgi:hypothetical protein